MPESFTVRRRNPELIAPARPTPRETKPLSDLDDSFQLRYLLPCLEFFLPAVADGVDVDHRRPVDAIKAALAEALVHYYPIAGRLQEIPDGKLAVECTGEGVVFVEAEADLGMEELGYCEGEPPMPPFRCAEEFLCDVGDSEVIIGKPLFFMQITQLKGGGFVFGTHICHCISDGFGTLQFLKAIVDLARGEAKPTTLPIWEREMVMASQPARINPVLEKILDELESANCDDIMVTMPTENMVCEYLTFSETEMAALRNHIPMNLTKKVTSFELIISVIWRCRTMALGYKPCQIVRLMINVNARGRWSKLRAGYYGNAIACPVIETTVNELCTSPLGHTIDLVRSAKHEMMSEENIQLAVDLMPLLRVKGSLIIERIFETCDIKWIGQDALDLGWAKRIGGGIPTVAGKVSYQSMHKNTKGEKSVVVSILLPQPAMDRFKKEMDIWLKN